MGTALHLFKTASPAVIGCRSRLKLFTAKNTPNTLLTPLDRMLICRYFASYDIRSGIYYDGTAAQDLDAENDRHIQRVVGYVRVSMAKQADTGYGLDAQ
jgi:hypothetical protein